MAHFSEFQAAHYRQIFDFFAEPNGQIGLHELWWLLKQFGPEVELEELDEILSHHLQNNRDTLNFAEFLELLVEYEHIVSKKVGELQLAFEYLHKNHDILMEHGFSKEQFTEILSAGDEPLDKREIEEIINDYFKTTKQYSFNAKHFLEAFHYYKLHWINDKPPPLQLPQAPTYTLYFHINHLENISSYYSTKYRRGIGIDFQSLDAMIVIRCGEQRVETQILLANPTPEWNQELVMTLELPSALFIDIQYWIESHPVIIEVWDLNYGQNQNHLEYLAHAIIPLSTLLRSSLGPVTHCLPLHSHSLLIPLKLEFSLRFTCSPSISLIELFMLPEPVWFYLFHQKLELDLSNISCIENVETPPLTIVAHLSNVLDRYHIQFRRRHIRLIALDENNSFHVICCFIHPFYLNNKMDTKTLIEQVSHIGTGPFNLPVENLTSHFGFQIFSPSTIISYGYCSELDHAILLCNFLLGLNLDCYVCCGNGLQNEWRFWVVIISQGISQSIHSYRSLNAQNDLIITHIDSVNGQVYSSKELDKSPFSSIGCLFNQYNIWLNTQFNENLSETNFELLSKNWTPAFSVPFLYYLNYCYDLSIFKIFSNDILTNPEVLSHDCLIKISKQIQKYRNDYHFCNKTFFYTPLCKSLKLIIGELHRKYNQGETDDKYILSDTVMESTPDHCIWHGRCFHFFSDNISKIFKELKWSGILNCDINNVVYAIAVDVVPYHWDLQSVFICLIYFYNIDTLIFNK